ncbi:MAG: 1-(5-phosphoribosyl)-5-[(5-phosphoribosylamino)methylideneamino]imidazole-4-carboxamide isomerase [Desulfobacterota bacterium]|nr:1-(5-phosphoribosyl)-5-[(5-phosphoribosylamino)methylideneamino]imidazole-4-carboxamide isomerase [Thermodesulfobacteriota bacterium]
MIVIPAIDLKDGKCVRLIQGRIDQETIYSEDPVEMARYWEAKGAERLHLVDLNGAIIGRPFHPHLIEEILRSIRIPVEIGGGIREMATIEHYLRCGARWVILGTAALKNRPFLEEACREFPDRVILGLDAKGGKVAVEGWGEVSSLSARELVGQVEGIGLAAIIFTDINRDGMASGLNLEATRELARSTSIPVIASGGASRIEEIEALMALEPEGVIGVIVGRALYTGAIDLKEALELTQRKAGGAGLGRC